MMMMIIQLFHYLALVLHIDSIATRIDQVLSHAITKDCASGPFEKGCIDRWGAVLQVGNAMEIT